MTGKHTPGPWRYVRENGSPTTGPHMISGAIHGYLAEVRDCGSGDVAANARLIAAAPELLEALEAGPSMLHELPGGRACSCSQCAFVRLKRAAIAKAIGSGGSS